MANGEALAQRRMSMSTAILNALVANPWLAANTVITAALPGAALAYGLVWWAMRPKDGRRVPHPFAWHAIGLISTVVVSAIFRVIAMATFGGRSALELADSGTAGFYILVVPAIVAATLFAWRKRGLTTPAAPDATFSAEELAGIEAGNVDKGGWARSLARSGDDESNT